ncbi:shikimate kinase [Larkinella terrae]|uniref:Shikimate kinase n=1 Tax=Larkinella terrae TaxID=2025311 RepID=A0A7K0EPM7_9BACT|nr:shikimate kinase [Larkinella terrae]MRS63754.1 AAA family ATPase [Larkinella terrae]
MKNIFLVGMPSSGKSTLGKRLARHLAYRFVDTDKLIIRKEGGRSINDIFQTDGEAYFREVESWVLHTIKPGSRLVVATGGGMPCFHNNMAYIKETGFSIFLDVAPEQLLDRMLRHNLDDRPLFNRQDPTLLENLRQKYTDRRFFYTQADLIIPGETAVEELSKQIEMYL